MNWYHIIKSVKSLHMKRLKRHMKTLDIEERAREIKKFSSYGKEEDIYMNRFLLLE